MADFEIIVDTSGLDRMLEQEPQKVGRWMSAFAEEMVSNIKLSFGTSPPGLSYSRNGIEHVASQPDNPPNVDTGALRASIRWENTGSFERTISAGTEYAEYLENGAEDVGLLPRPFMGPEFEDARRRMADDARDNLGLGDI